MAPFRPVGKPLARKDDPCSRCVKYHATADQKDCTTRAGPLVKCEWCGGQRHPCLTMGDVSVRAFRRLESVMETRKAYRERRAGRRVSAVGANKGRLLLACVARERKRFLQVQAAEEHDPHCRIGDVRLPKAKKSDAEPRKPVMMATFREKVRMRGALEHLARESTKSRRAAQANARSNARTASALEAIALHLTNGAYAPPADDGGDDSSDDGESDPDSDGDMDDLESLGWDSEDDLLDPEDDDADADADASRAEAEADADSDSEESDDDESEED